MKIKVLQKLFSYLCCCTSICKYTIRKNYTNTSTCFYNALSRRQYEMPLVAFYGRVSALVFLVTMLAGVFLLVPGLGDMLLPDVPLWYAPLAAFYGFLLWGTRVVRSMNDALGLTVPGELLRSGVNLLGAIIILALFWFGFLNAGSLFGLQYLMMGSIVIGCLVIMRRSWAHIDLSLTRDQRLSYTRCLLYTSPSPRDCS